ncbi:RSP_7527 family protein [Pararhodobacter marinus]|uniref:RSP_7527 family protein n=1 Tax=Pararhodobacter marinus TaxID=2184063 RepID=UPI00143DD97C|nr:hypothetical protein [Pararhodobacter marinus]
MTDMPEFKEIDLATLERQAREMQAQALAEGFRSLRRGIVSFFSRGAQARHA